MGAMHCWRTITFRKDVGLHQGSAINPCLFIMDVLTETVRKVVSESMVCADDVVLCGVNEVDNSEERRNGGNESR